MDKVIIAENLTKTYDEIHAVDGISFSITKGECFGFLGPNGAGKTSVMKMLYCFMPPTSGTIEVMGMDVVKSPSEIKSREGVMPQDDNLDPDLSSLENLMVYARFFDIPKSKSIPEAKRLLEFAELTSWADTNIQKLSGGMRRRLLLARSLINNPELVILDEPSTGMDPHSRLAMWDNLKALKESGKTLLLTTHYMEEAERMCDRVAIMEAGKIIVMGTPSELTQTYKCSNLEEVYLKLTGRRLDS